MRIRRRNGKWSAEVRRKGQSFHNTFLDKKSAVQWATNMEKSLLIYTGGSQSLDTKILNIIEDYQRDFTLKKVSAKEELRRWSKIIKDYKWLVNLSIGEVSPKHFLEFKAKRLADGNRTFNMDLVLFNQLFKKAINIYKFPIENPVQHIEKAKENHYGRRRVITRAEYKLLLRTKLPYSIFFLLARNTGARPFSEITKWKWKDFDDVNNKIIIRKGKTNRATREIPLTQFLVNQVRKLKGRGHSTIIGKDESAITSMFKRFIKLHNIEDLQIYDFRREFVRNLVDRDVPVKKISKLTGHSWASAYKLTELYSGYASIRGNGF
tara:strand:- start:252 stop:1217 length:966 start_codon:yes stop_codon:yes gene_type:complete